MGSTTLKIGGKLHNTMFDSECLDMTPKKQKQKVLNINKLNLKKFLNFCIFLGTIDRMKGKQKM